MRKCGWKFNIRVICLSFDNIIAVICISITVGLIGVTELGTVACHFAPNRRRFHWSNSRWILLRRKNIFGKRLKLSFSLFVASFRFFQPLENTISPYKWAFLTEIGPWPRIQLFSALHYDDVIMGEIASQITSLTLVYSAVYSGSDQSKHQSSASLAFCVRNSPGTGEFPAQMASNAENVSIWWLHHVSMSSKHLVPETPATLTTRVASAVEASWCGGHYDNLVRSVIFPFFQKYQNTGYLYDTNFIFGMYHCSLPGGTWHKFEHDWTYLAYTFAESKFPATYQRHQVYINSLWPGRF